MFQRLIASRSRLVERGRTGAGLGALLGHGAVVVGAVLGTLRPTGPRLVVTPVPMALLPPQEPEAPFPTSLSVPAAPVVDPTPVPVQVPPGLPAIDQSRPFAPTEVLHAPLDVVGPTPAGTDGEGTWTSGLVEEPPVLLAGHTPSYPGALRAARITGRVVVQAVIDTLGHALPGATVVESSHAGFDAAALDYVRRALFRPGRVHGRPVRVLVRLPVDFRLTDGH